MHEYRVLRVDKIVDGDTVDVTLDLGFYISLKQRIRILGINASELKDKDPAEKELALKAKQFAEEWFQQPGTLMVKTTKDDKYGRMLGDFWFQGQEESFGETALKANIVRTY